MQTSTQQLQADVAQFKCDLQAAIAAAKAEVTQAMADGTKSKDELALIRKCRRPRDISCTRSATLRMRNTPMPPAPAHPPLTLALAAGRS